MLSDHVRILNFDDSVVRQSAFLAPFATSTVDLTGMGPAARLWASRAQIDVIRASLDPACRSYITLLGSGDYHYVSSLLVEQFEEPLTLVVFDHHPDWDMLPPRYGCGAWINRVVEQNSVHQVVLVGNASKDLTFPSIMTGNLRSVRAKRVLMLPYEVPARQIWPFANIPWHELRDDPHTAFSNVIDRLSCRRVYVSIDKDCLTASCALTNWEEGRLTLELLLSLLRTLKQKCEIVGLDIAGDYSPVTIPSGWKSWCSTLDHPKEFSARGRPLAEITQVNGRTNRRIIEFLNS
jgi:hypothetical protein